MIRGMAPPAPDQPQTAPFPRGLIVLLAGAGAVVSVAGIKALSGILAPLFLALMLVVAVDPVMGWLMRRRVHRVVAAILTLLVAYAIVLGLAVAVAVSVARLATLLPTYTDQFNELLDDVESFLQDQGVDQDRIQEALSGFDYTQVLDLLQSVLQSLLDVFANVFFLLAVMLFMVMDAAHFHDRLAHVEQEKPDIVRAFRGFASGTRTYLVVSTVFGAIVAVIDGFALAIIGVPLPVLWGLLAFITNYIPNIGFVIGLIPPALLALLGGGVGDMIAVIVVYSVINFVIQSLIQPKFVGNAVGLSVTLTFVSLVFWAWVMGALGALLAIPLTLLTKALLLDIDPSVRWVNGLITSGQPPDADAGAGRGAERVANVALDEAEGIGEADEEAADEEPADAPPRAPTG